MPFAKLNAQGAIVAESWPFTLTMLLREVGPNLLPDNFAWTDEELAALPITVVRVADNPPPEPAEGQTVDQGLPVQIEDGTWQRNWLVHDWLPIDPTGRYARVVAGEVVKYPFTWSDFPVEFGIQPQPGFEQADDEYGLVPVLDSAPPAVTDAQRVEEIDPIYSDGAWRQAWTIVDRSTDELAAAKAELLAITLPAKRYAIQTGGMTVAGIPVRTDAESQRLIAGAVQLLDSVPDLTQIDFKAQADQWVTLSREQMTAIGIALGMHIQRCFAQERLLSAAVANAQTWADLAAIDITEGWPQ